MAITVFYSSDRMVRKREYLLRLQPCPRHRPGCLPRGFGLRDRGPERGDGSTLTVGTPMDVSDTVR